MSKKTIITCLCAGCCLAASAQTDLESFREQYQFNQRDLQVVERYVDALENAGMYKEAENVAKEYMSRCPVVQITDKDTYLLLNKYLFTDPYSNVFEYGIYAVKNMKWDREEPTTKEEKDARMKRLFRDMRYGVSGVDEIDKRYEILSLLSRNLKNEIEKQCEPVFQDNRYILPSYDSLKLERLNYLVNKGELLGQDGMRVKLAIRKALQEGDREQVVDFMETAVTMGLTGMDGNYLVSVMTLLAEGLLKPQLVNRMLAFVLQLSRVEEAEGGMTNYYNLLGTLYGLAGDGKNAEKYTRMGNAIEAERRERYKDIFNINPEL